MLPAFCGLLGLLHQHRTEAPVLEELDESESGDREPRPPTLVCRADEPVQKGRSSLEPFHSK